MRDEAIIMLQDSNDLLIKKQKLLKLAKELKNKFKEEETNR
jgi:hypothetical protein